MQPFISLLFALTAASQHEPPLFLDLGATWINVVSHDMGYMMHATFRIYGATSSKDRVRIEWKAGGKAAAPTNCTANYYEGPKTLFAQCELEHETTASGPIDLDVIYIDDQNDKEYLVQTLHFTVKNWKGIGKFQNWGILPDDLLGVALVRHWYDDTSFHTPLIEFWSTSPKLAGDAVLRCTVDGKKIPDIEAPIGTAMTNQQREIHVSVTMPKETKAYHYEHYNVEPKIKFGSKNDHGLYDPTKLAWLEDQPGLYDCILRKEGHAVRQFTFTVNAKGFVEQSEMQKGAHPLPTLNNVVLIDMKIPADNGYELRLRPDAMKKSIGFGVPWPDGAKVKEIQAAFPPAMGLAD